MHLARRGYLLIVLMALLGIAGTWSDDPAFEGAWLLPAFLLLAGLALEAWYLRGTQVSVRMRLEPRLKLGRASLSREQHHELAKQRYLDYFARIGRFAEMEELRRAAKQYRYRPEPRSLP